ncbi:hypothetical protein ACHAWF_013409 [Thalassiosira exigua]
MASGKDDNGGRTDEDERTSLLASSSAPPGSLPRPTLDRPYNPSHTPQRIKQELQWQQQQQQQNQSQYLSSKPRQTLTTADLTTMERGAARLADDVGGDTDSVNALLGGMSDDEASSFGGEGGEDAGGPVTPSELEFLARRSSDVSGIGMEEGKRRKRTSRRTKMVDDLGDELLGARDDAVLERRILRKSLRLDAGKLLTDVENDAAREAFFRAQSSQDDGGAELAERVHESTHALRGAIRRSTSVGGGSTRKLPPSKGSAGSFHPEIEPGEEEEGAEKGGLMGRVPALAVQIASMMALMAFVIGLLAAALMLGSIAVGPPRQPLGEYRILEAQEGEGFFGHYDFYAGKDSAGSNGYITYVSREKANALGIVEVITERVPTERMIEVYEDGDVRAIEDWLAEDVEFLEQLRRKKEEKANADIANAQDDGENGEGEENGARSDGVESGGAPKKNATAKQKAPVDKKATGNRRHLQNVTADDLPAPHLEAFNPDNIGPNGTSLDPPTETVVRISSSPTPEGPRNSVRLEGRRRFNRGLFIIDLRHMPAGCGTWPAFWLTDEANWPVNGEIDIVEGVNYQDTAKTALHATRECRMDDVPEGSKTGTWDTAIGIPDRKTGIPDMTFRWAQNCFVYDPHQWINQGCVATDLKLEGRSLGMPLNANGGGVYALEWDPVNRHIRTWVFSPHGRVPSNLREALRTATVEDVAKRVAPDTNQWGLPYGHFPIGEGTNCPSGHFRNMRLVINLAFCGSVAGNRYFMDCPKKFKKWKTCNEYVASDPEELKEAYWKIRGVYVYEREWERQWT